MTSTVDQNALRRCPCGCIAIIVIIPKYKAFALLLMDTFSHVAELRSVDRCRFYVYF